MIGKLSDPTQAAPLFAGWEETILWSCLSGAMGSIYATRENAPTAAMACLGDFCFFAGEPSRELALFQPEPASRVIAVPQTDAWSALLKDCYGPHATPAIRYATKKEPSVFHRPHLEQAAASLPPEYHLAWIDEALFSRARTIPWCQDWVASYRDFSHFQQYGLGVAVMRNGEPVSGASSYSGWPGGIEIEIDTREDYRRRGLAYAAAAALILACLDRGLYPSWDAQNLASLALAEKLGYGFSHEYPVLLLDTPATPC